VLSNNPRKYFALSAYGLEVVEHLPLVTPPTPDNIRYLRTKRDKLGHHFDPTLAVEAADASPTPPADPGTGPRPPAIEP
jgi:hypothetical protein